MRRQALYIIDNLNLVNLALRLCDFKDIHMAVEAKQVGLPSCCTVTSSRLRMNNIHRLTCGIGTLYSVETRRQPDDFKNLFHRQLPSQALHSQMCMYAGAFAVGAGQTVLTSCNLPCAGT